MEALLFLRRSGDHLLGTPGEGLDLCLRGWGHKFVYGEKDLVRTLELNGFAHILYFIFVSRRNESESRRYRGVSPVMCTLRGSTLFVISDPAPIILSLPTVISWPIVAFTPMKQKGLMVVLPEMTTCPAI